MTSGATAAAESAALGTLPEWDLRDLYPAPDSPALAEDLARAEREARDLHGRYAGRLAALDGDELGAVIAAYERLHEVLGRIMSYSHLCYATAMEDPAVGRFFQTMQERVNDIATALLFVTLEINRIDDDRLAEQLRAPAAARYAPWLRDLRAHRPYQLSDEVEKLLHDKSVAGRAAWSRLFDETAARLRFPVDGRDLTSAEVIHLLSSHDGAARANAAAAMSQVFRANIQTFALITNTLAKDKEIEDRWRGFAQPISSRNLANQVEDSVVEALLAAVTASYPRLAHRYYRLKARWFGVDRLDYWDRNAPLPEDRDRTIGWDEARETVLAAWGRFSPQFAEIGQRFFARPWIHAPVRPGKAPGAFAHPSVPSVHPYLLLNYQGRTRDVMTLAHELGHGVHQILAGAQGALMAETPLTLAETASVFGEQLTFRALLDAEEDPVRRRVMLAGKVEDMLNTVVRQVAFCDFERRLHGRRRDGELTPDDIGELWMDSQSASLGPAIRLDDGYRVFWAYIPHFIHAPFYVYAYAFGDCLVNALYAVYQEAPEGFAEKYLTMLKAGGTLRHRELLAPFGLDAGDASFWNRGLDVIAGFIDELEASS